jgi:hypothetical protein
MSDAGPATRPPGRPKGAGPLGGGGRRPLRGDHHRPPGRPKGASCIATGPARLAMPSSGRARPLLLEGVCDAAKRLAWGRIQP